MKIPFLNFPRFHEELVENNPSDNIVFLASCLSSAIEKKPLKGCESFLAKLPIPPKEAYLRAEEIKHRGSELWSSGLLAPLSIKNRLDEELADKLRAEDKALAKFTEKIKKGSTSLETASPDLDEEIRTKQKESNENLNKFLMQQEILLFLAYDLEKSFLEAKKAEHAFCLAERNFALSMHAEKNLEEKTLKEIIFGKAEEKIKAENDLGLSLQKIMLSLVAFLPEETVFFSNDEKCLDLLTHWLKEGKAKEIRADELGFILNLENQAEIRKSYEERVFLSVNAETFFEGQNLPDCFLQSLKSVRDFIFCINI